MSAAVLDRAMDLVRDGRGPFHLQLTGGEPTLVPQSIERAVRRARSITRPCTIGIQTNGSLLDAGLVKFFRHFGVQVGLSLDGPPAVQESLLGEAAKTFRGLQLLESHGVPFRVTTVVSGANVGHLDRLVWTLAAFGRARGLGLDLLVRKGRAGASALRAGVGAMMAALDAANRGRPAACFPAARPWEMHALPRAACGNRSRIAWRFREPSVCPARAAPAVRWKAAARRLPQPAPLQPVRPSGTDLRPVSGVACTPAGMALRNKSR